MQDHMQTTRKSLSGLHMLAHQTRESEKRILDAAEEQLAQVEERIRETRPQAVISPTTEYQGLIIERGRLQTVIGNARRALSE
jgi:hypothetical protein